MHEPLMPTAISFSLDVPHETSRSSLSGSLQARLQPPERSVEELRADSERATERTRQLREAHIESVKERAARESQRCDEVAARKRRMMHEEAQTLVARMGMKDGYYDAFLEDKREKQESEKARRAALAEAASESFCRCSQGIKGFSPGGSTSSSISSATSGASMPRVFLMCLFLALSFFWEVEALNDTSLKQRSKNPAVQTAPKVQ